MSSEKFETLSGIPLETYYSPKKRGKNYKINLGNPGEYPYTRGIHKTGYRGKLWTMRQFAGFGTAEETNGRFKYLLSEGQTGLSTAFDLPTLYGRDTDDPGRDATEPPAWPDFGEGGVACSSLLDMEALFKDIPLEDVSVSMTINGPASIIWAMFLANSDNRGFERKNLRGTLQNDILKEFHAQNEQLFPLRPSMRLVADTIGFAIKEVPLFNPVSVSGYHIREKGSTAVQELAFTLSDGFAYLDECLTRGMDIDEVAPRLSFFFNSHNDFFEEICKFRAARRIWAKELKEKYGAKQERSWKLRFHTQTAGCSLYQNRIANNEVRITLQALAAVLGGTQSLHTDAVDEAESLPTQEAVKKALRTQQIIAYESGVAKTVDPLGGSYFIEGLTNHMEQEARKYFEEIEKIGGVIAAAEEGYQKYVIEEAGFEYEMAKDRGDLVIVGVNKFLDPRDAPTVRNKDPQGLSRQLDRLKNLRANRNNDEVLKSLAKLKDVCQGHENVMPALVDAAKAYATLGEMTNKMKEVFGEAQRPT